MDRGLDSHVNAENFAKDDLASRADLLRVRADGMGLTIESVAPISRQAGSIGRFI
jgi:hypothetical protein